MFNYDQTDYSEYDDDLRFYEETAFNDEYYADREREFVRQSNLETEDQEREEKYLQEARASQLPFLSQPPVAYPSVRTSGASLPVTNHVDQRHSHLSYNTSLNRRRYH